MGSLSLIHKSKRRCFANKTKQQGFTLIELVTTIVILGVLAVGASSFLKFGSKIFIDAIDRDEIISSARFSLERLNRELRQAVPNSHRITPYNGDKCIEFMPIKSSAVYIDIPLTSNAVTEATLVPDTVNITAEQEKDYFVVVYPLEAADVYDSNNEKFYPVANSDFSTDPYKLTFAANTAFDSDSTTKRIFFFDTAILYCIKATGQLARYEVTGRNSVGLPITRDKEATMAEDLLFEDSSFTVEGPSRTSNSVVEIRFVFKKNAETIAFINEVHIPNVP